MSAPTDLFAVAEVDGHEYQWLAYVNEDEFGLEVTIEMWSRGAGGEMQAMPQVAKVMDDSETPREYLEAQISAWLGFAKETGATIERIL